MSFRIVLVEPEIPSNTGSIGRSCLGLNSELHLIKPLGFDLSDKRVKRAGLDYWPRVQLFVHEDFESWWKQVEEKKRVFFFTTKVKKTIFENQFARNDWLVFGPETRGLDEKLLSEHSEQCLTLPQSSEIRSYNLACATSMVLTEATRQTLVSF